MHPTAKRGLNGNTLCPLPTELPFNSLLPDCRRPITEPKKYRLADRMARFMKLLVAQDHVENSGRDGSAYGIQSATAFNYLQAVYGGVVIPGGPPDVCLTAIGSTVCPIGVNGFKSKWLRKLAVNMVEFCIEKNWTLFLKSGLGPGLAMCGVLETFAYVAKQMNVFNTLVYTGGVRAKLGTEQHVANGVTWAATQRAVSMFGMRYKSLLDGSHIVLELEPGTGTHCESIETWLEMQHIGSQGPNCYEPVLHAITDYPLTPDQIANTGFAELFPGEHALSSCAAYELLRARSLVNETGSWGDSSHMVRAPMNPNEDPEQQADLFWEKCLKPYLIMRRELTVIEQAARKEALLMVQRYVSEEQRKREVTTAVDLILTSGGEAATELIRLLSGLVDHVAPNGEEK